MMATSPWAWKSSFLLAVAVAMQLCLFSVKGYVVDEGITSPEGREPKVTRLHFFLQDVVSGGGNATAVKVAGTIGGPPSPILFGDVFVVDDLITEGVEPSSQVVGNAQGIYAFTGRESISVFMSMDFGFTTGEFNGSSISLASRNRLGDATREVAVVGGRGRFRLARGFALLTTRYFNNPDAIVEYNVTVLHH